LLFLEQLDGFEELCLTPTANGNAIYHFHFDRVGSTLALTTAAGAVTDAYTYTPYGELLGRTGTNAQPFTYVGAFGVRSEPTANLYHMRARYYEPVSARFISRDPVWPVLTEPRSLDPYQYAFGSPEIFIDPAGLFARGLKYDENGVLQLTGVEPRYGHNTWDVRYYEQEKQSFNHWFDVERTRVPVWDKADSQRRQESTAMAHAIGDVLRDPYMLLNRWGLAFSIVMFPDEPEKVGPLGDEPDSERPANPLVILAAINKLDADSARGRAARHAEGSPHASGFVADVAIGGLLRFHLRRVNQLSLPIGAGIQLNFAIEQSSTASGTPDATAAESINLFPDLLGAAGMTVWFK